MFFTQHNFINKIIIESFFFFKCKKTFEIILSSEQRKILDLNKSTVSRQVCSDWSDIVSQAVNQ